jgi:WD40 repeat protein
MLIHKVRAHEESIWCAVPTHDGKQVVSGSIDCSIRIWDTLTGECLNSCSHGGIVTCLDLSSDGHYMVSGGKDTVLWSLLRGLTCVIEKHRLREHHDTLRVVKFSPDSRRFASAGDDGVVMVWCVQTANRLQSFHEHKSWVRTLAWSSDSKLIASGGCDAKILVWDVDKGKSVMKPLTGHASYVYSVVFDKMAKFLVSGSHDKAIMIWELRDDGAVFKRKLVGHTDCVSCVSLCEQDKFLASASYDLTVRIWDFASGEQIRVFNGHYFSVYSVAWVPGSLKVVSCGHDRSLRIAEIYDTVRLCVPACYVRLDGKEGLFAKCSHGVSISKVKACAYIGQIVDVLACVCMCV